MAQYDLLDNLNTRYLRNIAIYIIRGVIVTMRRQQPLNYSKLTGLLFRKLCVNFAMQCNCQMFTLLFKTEIL